jgi:hypothetical protein
MAQGDAYVYDNFKEQLLLAQHNMATDSLKVCLVDSTFDIVAATYGIHGAAPAYPDMCQGHQVSASGTNYTTTGLAVTGQAVSQDLVNYWGVFACDDVTYGSLQACTPTYGIMYKVVTGAGIIAWELGPDANGGDYSLQFTGGKPFVIA